MNDLIVVEKLAEWQRLKALVLDSVSSPITRRVYNMALDEFIEWFNLAPRPGFTYQPTLHGRKPDVNVHAPHLDLPGCGDSGLKLFAYSLNPLLGGNLRGVVLFAKRPVFAQ